MPQARTLAADMEVFGLTTQCGPRDLDSILRTPTRACGDPVLPGQVTGTLPYEYDGLMKRERGSSRNRQRDSNENPTGSDSDSTLIGRKPVAEALSEKSGQIDKLFIQRGVAGSVMSEIHRNAREAGIPVQFVPRQRLDRMTGGVPHQGVIARTSPVAFVGLETMLHEIAANPDEVRARRPILLLLEGIQDPRNLGAILRTAAAAAVSGVVVSLRGTAPVSAAAMKSSAGAAARVPIARVEDLSRLAVELKERGYWIIGADSAAAASAWQTDLSRPLGLVMGSEGEGMSSAMTSACDAVVRIPMPGDMESLNVSVAAGILLFAATRAREGLD
jgi:23S rRNA (guanosine2251-2'-O)-methyltransferase